MTAPDALAGAPHAPAAGLGGHARALLALAVPLIGSNLAGFSIQVTDTLLMGWYGVTALAGLVLATSLWFPVFLLGSGFGIAVTPLAAKAAEEGNMAEVRRLTAMGLWLSLGYAALAVPVLLLAGRIFAAAGQDAGVADVAGRYLAIAGWGIFPVLAMGVLRSTLSAIERTRVLLWTSVAAALLNALWGYALIFGPGPFPEMGVEGAAWAALGTQAINAAALWAYVRWRLASQRLLSALWTPHLPALGRVFNLGWPIGGQLLAEAGLFAGSGVLVGWVGEAELAAHGVALLLASAAFMLHLGLSQAATVRAGQALGRGDALGLRQAAAAACLLSALFAALTAALFLAIPEPLMSLFVDPEDPKRPAVIAVGALLLAFAALFALFDGAQVLAMGLLRGMQDTAVPMLIAAFSYWLVGLAAAYALGFWAGWGVEGIWTGLVLGLVAASALLMARFWTRARRPLAAPAAPAAPAPAPGG